MSKVDVIIFKCDFCEFNEQITNPKILNENIVYPNTWTQINFNMLRYNRYGNSWEKVSGYDVCGKCIDKFYEWKDNK